VQVRDILLRPREEIVDAQDVVAGFQQAVDEVGTEKAGSAGNHDPLTHAVTARHLHPFIAARGTAVAPWSEPS
jgi:hypothetical protein